MPLVMEESKVKLNENKLNKKSYEYPEEEDFYTRTYFKEKSKDNIYQQKNPQYYDSEYHNFDFKYDEVDMEAEYDLWILN